MRCTTAVGVDDDLAPREACVSVGASDDELARRIDVELEVRVLDLLELSCVASKDAGQ